MARGRNLDFIYTPIKEKMREDIGSVNFRTYIESLKPVDLDGCDIVLQSPSETQASYINEKLADQITDSIGKADVGITGFMLVLEGKDGGIRPVGKMPGCGSAQSRPEFRL